MGRTASQQGSFEEPPTGNHIIRCYRMIDLGTQPAQEFQGKIKAPRNQVFVGFELPTELMADGRPFTVGAFWTNSLHKKATLRIVLQTWRNKTFTEEELAGFDLEKILSKPGIGTLATKDNGKVGLMGIGPLMAGMTCPPQINETFSFWIDEWNQAKFDSLPDGIKDIIKNSAEYKAKFVAPRKMSQDNEPLAPGAMAAGIDSDDIPF